MLALEQLHARPVSAAASLSSKVLFLRFFLRSLICMQVCPQLSHTMNSIIQTRLKESPSAKGTNNNQSYQQTKPMILNIINDVPAGKLEESTLTRSSNLSLLKLVLNLTNKSGNFIITLS